MASNPNAEDDAEYEGCYDDEYEPDPYTNGFEEYGEELWQD